MAPEGNYLTESRLQNALEYLYPNYNFINNKTVPYSGVAYRPDFRCEELKLIIEFDGPQHYTQTSTILRDFKKDEIYSSMGFKIIRIPCFVQLETKTIKLLFGLDYDKQLEFPHGFISKEATLPADFCELGVERFKQDLIFYDCIKSEILESLKIKLQKLGDIRAVLPKSLEHLIDCKP